ncbi:MAG: DsbA family protein [Gammaproteobacteria bacterium]|nr:DsbA family protein [Gammaproteobacteria bacterium]
MARLYYIHDPMCSWCWAFAPVWNKLRQQLPKGIEQIYLLGGLAPDSDEPMPMEMQRWLQNTWRGIQKKVPGTDFNFDFWDQCQPRRSTYPACRAVIAARNQEPGYEQEMILAIQNTYYLQARNPSDKATLVALARTMGLDPVRFEQDLQSQATQRQLLDEIAQWQLMDVRGFPSLLLESGGEIRHISHDYLNHQPMLDQITSTLLDR